jgi:hypothetical protein
MLSNRGKREVFYTLPWLMRGWLMSLIEGHDLRVGAEVGVWKGETTFFLLDHAPNLTLHAVDLWERQPGHECYDVPSVTRGGHTEKIAFDELYYNFLKKASLPEYNDRLFVHKDWSHKAAVTIPDGSLDFVFLDADHSYEAVKRDIEVWKPKVMPGGFLMGHDTHMDGVRRAVMECLTDYEVSFDTFCWIEPQ